MRDNQVSIPDALRNNCESVLSLLAGEDLTVLERAPRFVTEWKPRDKCKFVTGVVLTPFESVRLANDDSEFDLQGPQVHYRKLTRGVSANAEDELTGDFLGAEGEILCSQRLLGLLDGAEQTVETAPAMHRRKGMPYVWLSPLSTCSHLDSRSINMKGTCPVCGEDHHSQTGLWLTKSSSPYTGPPSFDALRYGHKASKQAFVVSLEASVRIRENLPPRRIWFEPIFSLESPAAKLVERLDETFRVIAPTNV